MGKGLGATHRALLKRHLDGLEGRYWFKEGAQAKRGDALENSGFEQHRQGVQLVPGLVP